MAARGGGVGSGAGGARMGAQPAWDGGHGRGPGHGHGHQAGSQPGPIGCTAARGRGHDSDASTCPASLSRRPRTWAGGRAGHGIKLTPVGVYFASKSQTRCPLRTLKIPTRMSF